MCLEEFFNCLFFYFDLRLIFSHDFGVLLKDVFDLFLEKHMAEGEFVLYTPFNEDLFYTHHLEERPNMIHLQFLYQLYFRLNVGWKLKFNVVIHVVIDVILVLDHIIECLLS